MSVAPKKQQITQDYIEVPVGLEKLVRMQVKDIIRFYADEKYITAVSMYGDEIYIVTTMDYLEKFYSDKFIRIHRSHMVAKDTRPLIITRDKKTDYRTHWYGQNLPVSRRRIRQIKEHNSCLIL